MADTDTTVSRLGIALGAVLVVLGIVAYVVSEFASVTALIPSVFGVLVALLGVFARNPERRRLAVYGIGVLAVLGVLGSVRGIPDLIALVTGGPVDSTVAALSQGAMIVVCLVLLAAVARDVLDARS